MNAIEIIVTVLGGGGVIYLVVERMFSHRHDKANAKGQEIANAHSVADLYKEIDVIVEAKTQPILDNQRMLMDELNDIKAHWCCYRSGCPDRVLYKNDDDTDSCVGGQD